MRKITLVLLAVFLLFTVTAVTAEQVPVVGREDPDPPMPYLHSAEAAVVEDSWACNEYASNPGWVSGAGAESFGFTANPEGWGEPGQCTFQLDTSEIPERVRYLHGWGGPGTQVISFHVQDFSPTYGWNLDANYNPSDNDVWNRNSTDTYDEGNTVCLKYNFTNSDVMDYLIGEGLCDEVYTATTTQSYNLVEDDILSLRVWGNSALETVTVKVTGIKFWYVDYMLEAYSTPFVADWNCHGYASTNVDADGKYTITTVRNATQRVGCELDLDERIFHNSALNEVSNSITEEGYFGITFEAKATSENFDLQPYTGGHTTNLMWTDTSVDIGSTFETYCLYWDDTDPDLAEWENEDCDHMLKNPATIADSATYMPFSIPAGSGFGFPVLEIKDMRLWSRWDADSYGWAELTIPAEPDVIDCTGSIYYTVTQTNTLSIDGSLAGIQDVEGCAIELAGLTDVTPFVRYWIEDDTDVGSFISYDYANNNNYVTFRNSYLVGGGITADDYTFTSNEFIQDDEKVCLISGTTNMLYGRITYGYCDEYYIDANYANPRHYPYNELGFKFGHFGLISEFETEFTDFSFELLLSNPVLEWTTAN